MAKELTFPMVDNSAEFHAIKLYPNGYGISVIRNPISYGNDKGLYEIAVLEGPDFDNAILCYGTHITSDVIGHLTEDEVKEYALQVENLTGTVVNGVVY